MLCGSCAVLRGRRDSREFPVALARGKHLFPFRTEKLSLTAPMVLGSQGPGRVGRRRFSLKSRPVGGSSSLTLARGGGRRVRRACPPGVVRRSAGASVLAVRRARAASLPGTR